ncbi:LytR/AlgR family response regulator transcription factor [Lunatibacter salilacus]|uniref:LytR/AlgR family response regulator transcription factor n=1 Tax=Lunatibacter salilacus TaxID=2483804 RepID=UPI00131EAD59|nr:LytTR family DNA-binding domain-containing protein [Lunatibacter salilacus]
MVPWLKTFRNPYPYYYKEIPVGYLAATIFLMSMGFNYLFEPFEVYRPEHRMGYFWISMVHSLNALWIALIWFGFWNRQVNEEKWTVGKEMLLIAGYLIMVGITQFLVRDIIYDNPLNWTGRYLYEEIRNTLLVGILFACILIPLNFLRLQRRHRNQAGHFQPIPVGNQENPTPNPIFIETRQKSDDFTIDPSIILVAKAEGNYLEIYITAGSKTEKLIKRMTLKDLENQLEHLPNFCKTHRSYLVNLGVVEQVKGNAQGLQLVIPGLDFTVPVSRTMIPLFEQQFTDQ